MWLTTFRASSADVTDELLAEVVRDIAEVIVDDGQRHGVHLTNGQVGPGSRGVTTGAQSHLTCIGAYNVHTKAVRTLLETVLAGAWDPDWSQDPTSGLNQQQGRTEKPLFRAGLLVGLTGFEPATT